MSFPSSRGPRRLGNRASSPKSAKDDGDVNFDSESHKQLQENIVKLKAEEMMWKERARLAKENFLELNTNNNNNQQQEEEEETFFEENEYDDDDNDEDYDDNLNPKASRTSSSSSVQKVAEIPMPVFDIKPAKNEPRGTVVLVFTDIQESTLLWNKHTKAMRAALVIHNQIIRKNVAAFGGYEVKTEGDAFMLAWQTADQALYACVQIQLDLINATWPSELLSLIGTSEKSSDGLWNGLRVRMGIHSGDAIAERDPVTGRMDYFGPTVNRAARVCSTAIGGEIVLSVNVIRSVHVLAVYDNNLSDFMSSTSVQSLGSRVLKGFEKGSDDELFQILPKKLSKRFFVDESTFGPDSACTTPRSPSNNVAAIVACSIPEGPSFWEEFPREMEDVLPQYAKCLRETSAKHKGMLCSAVGDHFMFSFPTFKDAVNFSLMSQNRLMRVDWPVGILEKTIQLLPFNQSEAGDDPFDQYIFRGPRVSMAIHFGLMYCEPTGTKVDLYFSSAVNIVAQMLMTAIGGEILISGAVYSEMKSDRTFSNQFDLFELMIKQCPPIKPAMKDVYRLFSKKLHGREQAFISHLQALSQETQKFENILNAMNHEKFEDTTLDREATADLFQPIVTETKSVCAQSSQTEGGFALTDETVKMRHYMLNMSQYYEEFVYHLFQHFFPNSSINNPESVTLTDATAKSGGAADNLGDEKVNNNYIEPLTPPLNLAVEVVLGIRHLGIWTMPALISALGNPHVLKKLDRQIGPLKTSELVTFLTPTESQYEFRAQLEHDSRMMSKQVQYTMDQQHRDTNGPRHYNAKKNENGSSKLVLPVNKHYQRQQLERQQQQLELQKQLKQLQQKQRQQQQQQPQQQQHLPKISGAAKKPNFPNQSQQLLTISPPSPTVLPSV